MISLDQLALFTRCFAPLNEDTYGALAGGIAARWDTGGGGGAWAVPK